MGLLMLMPLVVFCEFDRQNALLFIHGMSPNEEEPVRRKGEALEGTDGRAGME